MATLGSIVVGATLSLFDVDQTLFIWRTSKRDFFVLFVTFVLTLLLGPEYGVLVAVCLNIFFNLLDQYRMKTRELAQVPIDHTDALFDVLHPDIRVDEEEEAEAMQDMKPGQRVEKSRSDKSYVIRDHFPENSFTHPHLLIIRPTDSLTYVNIDKWVMNVVSQALERIPQQWDVQGSEEVKELRSLKHQWDSHRSLILAAKRRSSRSGSFAQSSSYAPPPNNGPGASNSKRQQDLPSSQSSHASSHANEGAHTNQKQDAQTLQPSDASKQASTRNDHSSSEIGSSIALASHQMPIDSGTSKNTSATILNQDEGSNMQIKGSGHPIASSSHEDPRRKKMKSKHIKSKDDAASEAHRTAIRAKHSAKAAAVAAVAAASSSTIDSISPSSTPSDDDEMAWDPTLDSKMKRIATADQLEEAVEEYFPKESSPGTSSSDESSSSYRIDGMKRNKTSPSKNQHSSIPTSSAAVVTDGDDLEGSDKSRMSVGSGGSKSRRRQGRIIKRHPGEEDYDDYIDALQHGELDDHHHHPHRSLETKRSSIIDTSVIQSLSSPAPSSPRILKEDTDVIDDLASKKRKKSKKSKKSKEEVEMDDFGENASIAAELNVDGLATGSHKIAKTSGEVIDADDTTKNQHQRKYGPERKYQPASPLLPAPAPTGGPKKKKEGFDVSFLQEDDDYYYDDEAEDSIYSSIEESFTASYSMSGVQPSRQPISIMSKDGHVRHAAKGELHEGEEEKVEEEANRKEIKEVAKKTRNLQGFVIIDMIHMNSMDSIVVGRLRDLFETLALNNISMAIARPRPITLKYLIRGGFVSLIGQDFAVDSISSCVIRCNAVLRAAMRFQAFKLMEAEENEEREAAAALQASLNASFAAISAAAIHSVQFSFNQGKSFSPGNEKSSEQHPSPVMTRAEKSSEKNENSENPPHHASYHPNADENV